MSSLKQKAVSGIKWSAIHQLVSQVLSIAVTIILARLLTPEDYGVIAMVMIFTSFSRVIINFGFKASIIQQQDITQKEISSIFWFNVFMGFVLTIVIICASPLIADFYGIKELIPLTLFISAIYFFSGLNVVQSALFNKELNFRILALMGIISNVLAGGIAIYLAYSGWSYWSLAIQMVFAVVFNTLALWWVSSWRPSFFFSWEKLKPSFKFSSFLFLNESVDYVTRNIDSILIGKYFGKADLGLYNKSYSFIKLPSQNITSVINRVTLPLVAKIQNETKKVQFIYEKIYVTVSLLSFMMMFAVFTGTEPFVLLVFGEQWLGIIPFVQLFSIAAIISTLTRICPSFLVAIGKSDVLFFQGTIKKVIQISCILLGLNFGIIGVATGKTIANILCLFVSMYYARKFLSVDFIYQIKVLAPLVVVGVASYLLLNEYRPFSDFSILIETGFLAVLGVVVYAVYGFFFHKKEIYFIVELFQKKKAKQQFKD